MSLLNRESKEIPKAVESANVERIITKDNLPASERKNIKVSPDAFKAIKILCANKDRKMYEFVDDLLNNYLDTQLNEREKRAILSTLEEQR